MSLKCNKRLFVRTVPRNILVILLLAILCAFSIWLLYDFSRPRIYRATLTFSLSDSVGKPLPIHKQNSILASLVSQSVPLNDSNLHSFSSNTFQKKDFHENIRLSRNGDFIDLTFEAGSFEAARRGLETWFSAFSQAIIKQKKNYC